MPQSLSNTLVHFVFSTKKRQNYLDDEICCKFYPSYIAGILKNNNCECLKIGGIASHVHILCALARTISISDLIEKIKSNRANFLCRAFSAWGSRGYLTQGSAKNASPWAIIFLAFGAFNCAAQINYLGLLLLQATALHTFAF